LGDGAAFSHLADDGLTERHVSYIQWERRIRSIAAVLSEHGKPGDRVLIVHQPGIEYVASLFACMYAGMVAVPVYPPDLFRLRQTLPRLQAITADADARIMLSSRDVLGESVGPLWRLFGDRAIATEEIEDHWADTWRGPLVRAGDLALLQFTSGSTGTPRGVALTHANILANAQQGFYAFDVPDAVCVFWLPPYHDLGLVGGMLIPVYGGRHSVLMSPIAFVQQPIRWFEAISRFRGTTTASPNFGYEWCLRKIQPEQCEGLDLSCWKLAAVGAEPVRAGTLERFARRFQSIGFSYSAFTPGYGMAEATLAITSKPIDGDPVVRRFDADALHAAKPVARPVGLDEVNRDVVLVSSGRVVRQCEVCIVDPQTRRLLPDGEIGEIWVDSPSVAAGYWNRPEQSQASFGVAMDVAPNSEFFGRRFLRTGDLGFLIDRELFVSGRLKEQIIIGGRNFFPHDIETAVQAAHDAFKVDGGVAFSIDADEHEQLVVVQEVLRPKRFRLDDLVDLLRKTVFAETGLTPQTVCLVAAASLPKTSSGKLRRLECKRQFLDGQLQILARGDAADGAATSYPGTSDSVDAAHPAADAEHLSATEKRLQPLWCQALEIRQAAKNQHFLEAGGHSLGANQLLMRIREEFATALTIADLVRFPRFGQLAAEIERRLDRPQAETEETLPPHQPAREMPLTRSQTRFWLLEQLDRRDAFLHVAVTFALRGQIDIQRWIRCCETLPDRHEALRAVVRDDAAAGGRQEFLDRAKAEVHFHDLEDDGTEGLDEIRRKLVHQRFDPATGPLIRMALVRIAADEYRMMFVAHHMVADGWSLGIIAQDLAHQYAAAIDAPPIESGPTGWSSAVARTLDAERLPASGELENYWRDRFVAVPASSSLDLLGAPLSDSSAASEDGPGSDPDATVVRLQLNRSDSRRLEQLARRLGVTPFSILVAGWHQVLRCYREESDMVFGIPVANRNHLDEARLVGCFIDFLPFRIADSAGDESFESRVRRTNGLLFSDLSHAHPIAETSLLSAITGKAPAATPLVQHLILQQPKPPSISSGKLRWLDYQSDYSGLAAYETTLVSEYHEDAMEIALAVDPRRIDSRVARNLIESLGELLRGAIGVGQPKRDSLLPPPSREERRRVAVRLSNLVDSPQADSFLRSFATRVAVAPHTKAIESVAGSLNYDQLDRRSAEVATWLRAAGYGPENRIGILLRRTPDLIATLIGIWKAGAAYLPMDSRQPGARLRAVIDDAAPDAILVDSETSDLLDAVVTACPVVAIQRMFADTQGMDVDAMLASRVTVNPDHAAYLMFTSGSTGKPKGVVVQQRNVSNFLRAMAKRPGFREGQRMLASTNLTFDISVLEMFLPLAVGGTAVLAANNLSDDPDDVIRFLQSRRIDVLQSTPSSLRMLLALGWQPSPSHRILCGGEPMPFDLAKQLVEAGVQLWNMYGPTETTVWSSVARISPSNLDQLSIGEPIDCTAMRIVDAAGRDVPQGVAGELWIGGEGVARGYWRRSELTERRFVHSEKESQTTNSVGRYYRTGDLVRLHTNDRLEILGRLDRQIKLRGHRIELAEIEQHLLRHPRVAQAAVSTVRQSSDGLQIIAFYTTVNDDLLSVDRLRDFLRQSLPEVMVPASLVRIAAMPLTPAGKIDYAVLPVDQCVISQGSTRAAATRPAPIVDEIERQIADIWRDVLGTVEFGTEDSFFHLGGHSLKAAQVFTRMRQAFGVPLPLKQIYSYPTVGQLASLVREAMQTDSTLSASNDSDGDSAAPADDAEQPLSFAERRLWFVDRLEPEHPFYNLPLAADIVGPLDVATLTECLNDVVARHETLRAVYRLKNGEPVREIQQSLRVGIDTIDLTDDAKRAGLDGLLHAEARRSFKLDEAPLVRVTVFKLSPERFVVLLVMHHIISDGWSMAVMLGELAETYRARRERKEPNLPALQTTYRQFAIDQRRRMTDQTMESSLAYWRSQLAGCTETLDLPTDFDRPSVQDFDGATSPLEIPASLTTELMRIAERNQCTPFMVLLAAYGVLLARHTGQQDFNIGTAVANRTDWRLESLIGFFVGTVVLRLQTEPDMTFDTLLARVRQTTIDAMEHAELPFERLVEAMAGRRDRSHSPLFQTALVLQNAPRDFRTAAELSLTPRHIDNGTAKYDLTLFLWEQDGKLVGHFEYRTSLFQADTIRRLGESMVRLLGSIVDQPHAPIDALPLVPENQLAKIQQRSFGPVVPLDRKPILHAMVLDCVERFGDRLAVSDGNTQWTYRDLEERSRRFAAALASHGTGIETPVILYMQRSADQIALQMGVMRAGGVFIPVDTSVPPERVVGIARDAGCKIIVLDDPVRASLESRFDDVALLSPSQLIDRSSDDSILIRWTSPEVTPQHLAYMIFTSGSTGKPKGVQIEHAAICNFVTAFCERVGLDAEDRFLNNLSPSFDGTLSQTFTALIIGAAVEVVSNEVLMDPRLMTDLINDRRVTFAACTPSMFASLDPAKVPGLKKVLSAGEPLTSEAAQAWMKDHQLYNGYGPTECTIGSAIHPIKPGFGRIPPIGRPLQNMSMYVLDQRGALVPDGVIGDVYIGGDSVGRGYLNLPELTAERFVPDPFIRNSLGREGRMYLTGDLGRWNHDGYLEIVGRGDNQIKLRGFRIEPGEIAAAMEELPEVRSACVVAWSDDAATGSTPRLVGYFVPNQPAAGEDTLSSDPGRYESKHIESWRTLFDQSHQQSGLVLDPINDFSGWQSVITGKQIPVEWMQQWADQSAKRIRQLQPKRILEIGCGTGLILFRLGADFDSYHGIDVLESSIEQLRKTLTARPDLEGKVDVRVGLADQLDDYRDGQFDTIVLNSVVQYFPSVEYLCKVLQRAIRCLAPGGKIFLGDLRDLRLHGAFATEVEWARAGDEALTMAKLRRRVLSRMEHDEELLLDPRMFEHLKTRIPRLNQCEVQFKIGTSANELNRYRFDATLYLDDSDAADASGAHALRPAEVDREGKIRRQWVRWRMLRVAPSDLTIDQIDAQVDRWIDACDDWAAICQAAKRDGYDLTTATVDPVTSDPNTWGNHPLLRRRSLELISKMRDQLRNRLPDYMIPSAFVSLDALPLTVQGKVNRAALPPPPAARPEWAGNWQSARDAHESLLVEIWEDLLEIDPIGIEDDFFELGGHSMLAVRMMAEVERRTEIAIPLATLFQQATIAHLAEFLRNPQASTPASALIPLTQSGTGAPLFCVHPAGGTVFCYRPLAERLETLRPVFGLQARGVDGRGQPHQNLDEMASYYAAAIRLASPSGPHHLMGWSLGGNIALEVARQLIAGGDTVASLTLLDSGLVSAEETLSESDFLPLIAALFPHDEHLPLEELRQRSPQQQVDYFIHQAAQAGIVPTDAGALGAQIFNVFQANIKAVHQHQVKPYQGTITLVRPEDQMKTGELFDDEALGWRSFADEVRVVMVPGDHASMLRSPAVDRIAEILSR
jgi:amino acid adenylation domain-containing protein